MSHKQGIGITVGGQRPADTRQILVGAPGPVQALYIHVPFCAHKCHYCDFYSFVDNRDQQEAYTHALLQELRVARHVLRGGLQTVFVGGGTPSLLRPQLWGRILDELHNLVPGFPGTGLEFTVECNPESASAETLKVLASGGVNRVSMGAQSFDPSHLKTLERIHQPVNVQRALGTAADAGIERRNIDLIYAIPDQTIADWRHDLRIACDLARTGLVDHISAYALTYEPNTAMTQRLKQGEFVAAEDSLEADMYDAAVEAFSAVGLDRYEVSNFARRGSECRHNLVYWRCGQWLAAGPSASGHVAGSRWKNVPKLGEWIDGVTRTGGYAPAIDVEQPDAERSLREQVMMGLRTREGINRHALELGAQDLNCAKALDRECRSLEARGQVETVDGRLRLCAPSFLWCDGIAARLMDAITRNADR